MTLPRTSTFATAVVAVALSACSSMQRDSTASSGPDTAVVVLPTSGAAAAIQAGCWASFYDERSFNGDSLTLIGPVELQTLDKGTARQLRRDIKSVVTGPRASLTVYQKQLLSARSVAFPPDSRESGLVEKLGFGGRIESMQLTCS
jgi:hypothetical protein